MNRYQIIALALLIMFYAINEVKMLSQKRKGIQTDQIAKGKSDKKRYCIEAILKTATISIIPVELFSVFYGHSMLRYSGKSIGITLCVIGVVVFLTAVITMANSWRAGIAENEDTEFVNSGIYKISRNPAFLGFDLVYIGILLIFFNWLLVVFTLWTVIMLHLQILQEERYLSDKFGEKYSNYKKKVCRYFGRKSLKFFIPFAVVVLLIVSVNILYGSSQMAKLTDLSFKEMIEYTTANNSDAIITVGIIKDGNANYTVYGENGRELNHELHTYEIGSLTKTFTATCISKAVNEEKISLDDTINKYLDLPDGNVYPTVEELLTHTSGYKGYYFESPMIVNYLIDRNIFHGITKDLVLSRTAKISLSDEKYEFNYSNYGYALLGLILEKVYGEEYYAIVNNFATYDLELDNTAFTIDKGDLGNYWTWYDSDAYASAGALTSNIEDMMKYAQLQLTDRDVLEQTHKSLEVIDASTDRYESMNIYIDEIGMAWIIDNENSFIWHNGGTDDYNCYLGFCLNTRTAVVILSNLPSGYRIPATVMGVKLLKDIQ